MAQKSNILLGLLILSILIAGIVVQAEFFSNNSQIEIELLNDPIAGEQNTLQASSNKTNLEGKLVYVNGEEYGKLNKAGITKFNVPDTDEMKIKINGYTETRKVEKSEGPVYEEGINIETDPIQGEINRIVLIDNGERISSETVSVNEKEIGRTGENGAIKFTVPKTEQLEIKTSAENIQSETVEVESQG